jgi:putative endonuclease
MHYVYVLHSTKDRKLYIGKTPDLKARIKKHKTGYVRSTKHRRPLKLVYYEAYILKKDAKRRERYLKSGGGRKELAKQLESIFDKIDYKYSKSA